MENHRLVDNGMCGKLLDCSFYLINLFPEFQIHFFSLEFQIPYVHFFPFYKRKKADLKGNIRRSVRAHNLLSSQISGHLNKAPIKIQSLSLLIGSVVTGSTNADFSQFHQELSAVGCIGTI